MINPEKLVLQPFYQIYDARYMMYWMTLTNNGYKSYLDSIAKVEKEKLGLDKRTIDFVAPGEQQPEEDHQMQSNKSHSANANDHFYRDASDGGYFSYNLTTNNKTNLSLVVRYWGAEWGNRKFDIYIDDQKLITEDNTGRWNQSKFFDITYPIPESMLQGKNNIRVKFRALAGNTAGGVYYVRLIKNN
jgi:hypothetical protein